MMGPVVHSLPPVAATIAPATTATSVTGPAPLATKRHVKPIAIQSDEEDEPIPPPPRKPKQCVAIPQDSPRATPPAVLPCIPKNCTSEEFYASDTPPSGSKRFKMDCVEVTTLTQCPKLHKATAPTPVTLSSCGPAPAPTTLSSHGPAPTPVASSSRGPPPTPVTSSSHGVAPTASSGPRSIMLGPPRKRAAISTATVADAGPSFAPPPAPTIAGPSTAPPLPTAGVTAPPPTAVPVELMQSFAVMPPAVAQQMMLHL
ncbi:hypothetical protein K438DRAFT_1952799 [Mycena galopus ATCC 62051]|nr:hypothetical protein K438DRAFT_1952799 [Mycena galopus ATCC 62051]